jgi:hypothetical protein
MAASNFVRRNLCLPKRATAAVLHTRYATQGLPEFRENNHPIPHGSLVGVHNGIIYNDDLLWGSVVNKERRYAEVDSEVIFAALAHGLEDSGADVFDVLSAIRGPAAVAWLDKEHPNKLFLARANTNPLMVGQTEGGSLIFASTTAAVKDAAEAVGLELTHIRDTQEGSLLTVDRGHIEAVRAFTPAPSYTSSYSSGYRRGGGWSAWDNDPWDGDSHAAAADYGFKWDKDKYEWVKDGEDSDGSERLKQAVETFMDVEPETDTPWALNQEQQFTSRLFDFDYEVEVRGDFATDPYFELYEEREAAVDDWFSNFRASSTEAFDQMTTALKAFIRPGDPVSVRMSDGKDYAGEVASLPMTFPGGDYLIRVCLPLPKRQVTPDGREYEIVLVRRDFNGFKSVDHNEQRALLNAS